jgi:predicted kinase
MFEYQEDRVFNRRRLILTVGLPRAGKSTWARGTGFPMVNPDSIRLALHGQVYQALAEDFVWAIAKNMVKSLFIAGHENVILDATNTTHKRQEDWEGVAEDVDAEVYFKVFYTMSDLCIDRAITDNKEVLIPVIKRMTAAWEHPPEDKCL